MNFKKSLLSLAAIIALGNTVLAEDGARYVPLTNTANDSSWIMFGVNGFSTGTPDTLGSASAEGFSTGFETEEDTILTDDLPSASTGLSNLATVQALAAAATPVTGSLFVGIDVTGETFNANEAVRAMYIQIGSTSEANVLVNYKASLEGKKIEILVDGVLYNTVISQVATWDDPAIASLGAAGSQPVVNETIASVLDYGTNDNPVDPKYFDDTAHLEDETAATPNRASMYHFNAISQQWETWNYNNSGVGNDFEKLHVGRAYWGKVDKNNAANDNGGDADGTALVLGKSTQASNSLPDPDRYQDDSNVSTLTDGWNMLSFDETKPYIRHAATGLVLTGITAADVFEITDSTGVYTHTVDLGAMAASTNTNTACTYINKTIESAKLLGTLPNTFNIKAFYSGTAGKFILISDAKFFIAETGDAGAIGVKTLVGNDPFEDGEALQAVADLGDAGTGVVSSAYGEYAMMLDIMADDYKGAALYAGDLDGVAADTGNNVSAKIIFGDTDGDNAAVSLATPGAADTVPTYVTVKAQIAGDAIFTATGLNDIDTDNDATADKLLIAAATPFYVKDSTYVRVFDWDTGASTGGAGNEITVSNTISAAIDPGAGANTAAIVAAITAEADDNAGSDTEVYATAGTGDRIITVATNNAKYDLKDIEDGTEDLLTPVANSLTAETLPAARGAIQGAYSLDEIARTPLSQWNNVIAITTNAAGPMNDDAANTIDFNVGGGLVGADTFTNIVGSGDNLINTYDEAQVLFDNLVTLINAEIATQGYHGFAAHDYTFPAGVVGTDTFPAAATLLGSIYIDGVDMDGVVDLVFATGGAGTYNGTGVNTQTGSNETTLVADLATDVRSNPVHSPDFAKYGPLYTLRQSGTGYDVKAMLKATTDLTDSSITWDSIDNTRHEDEWFANNEFNLFSIDEKSGYWVYLEDAVTNSTFDITNLEILGDTSLSYTYYFSNDGAATPAHATTNIINGATISATITGLDDHTSLDGNVAGSVYATIGSQEIRLTRTTGSDVFTGNLTNYNIDNFAQSTVGPKELSIRAVNGKGDERTSVTNYEFDFVPPQNLVVTSPSATTVTLTTDTNDTAKFYIFEDYIPELATTRNTTGVIKADINATAGTTATYGVCSAFSFGTTNTLRAIAVDGSGTLGRANVSDAAEFKYTSTLKGSHVLAHTEGATALKSQIGALYNSSCTLATTQPADASDNNGVSIKSLDTGVSVSMAFVPLYTTAVIGTVTTTTPKTFTTDVAWTSRYEVGGTTIAEIQNIAAYANDVFYVSYDGELYSGTFPADEATADASIAAPITLTGPIDTANKSLVP